MTDSMIFRLRELQRITALAEGNEAGAVEIREQPLQMTPGMWSEARRRAFILAIRPPMDDTTSWARQDEIQLLYLPGRTDKEPDTVTLLDDYRAPKAAEGDPA